MLKSSNGREELDDDDIDTNPFFSFVALKNDTKSVRFSCKVKMLTLQVLSKFMSWRMIDDEPEVDFNLPILIGVYYCIFE